MNNLNVNISITQRLMDAYQHYDKEIFDNQLGTVILTIDPLTRFGSYFLHDAIYHKQSNTRLSVIAIGTDLINDHSYFNQLGGLVHEAAHLWVYNQYKEIGHNAHWTEVMRAINLLPHSPGHLWSADKNITTFKDEVVDHTIKPGLFYDSTVRLLNKGWKMSIEFFAR